jgi:hypothetical protein
LEKEMIIAELKSGGFIVNNTVDNTFSIYSNVYKRKGTVWKATFEKLIASNIIKQVDQSESLVYYEISTIS